RGGSPRPVKPPRAGVDLEVAAGPAPPADHGTARGIEHELHDPVVHGAPVVARRRRALGPTARDEQAVGGQVELERARLRRPARADEPARSEEHTSELQSRENLVCRLLLEKKNHTNYLSLRDSHTL